MSRTSTHRPHDEPGRGPLTRLLGGLAPRGRARATGRPTEDVLGPGAATPGVGTVTDPAPVPAGIPLGDGRGAASTGLTPAWQDWADRRRTGTVPTPRPGGADEPAPGAWTARPVVDPTVHAPDARPTAPSVAQPVVTPTPRAAGARPASPWAAVRLGDGRTVTVTSTVLLGRAPAARAGETPGALLTVADPHRSVSKTHLAVGVDRGGAWVVDRSSTNGTVVTLPDGARILCVPERRVRLVPGASVAFGDAALTLTAVARHHATDEESTP